GLAGAAAHRPAHGRRPHPAPPRRGPPPHTPPAAPPPPRPYDASDHALARFAPDVAAAAADLAPRVTADLLAEVTAEIPDAWLTDEPGFDTPDDLRRAYAGPLLARAGVVHERITGIEGTK
ncbi:hypothetical protein ABT288_48795, partial [Streptomyces sp. NPDC001093]